MSHPAQGTARYRIIQSLTKMSCGEIWSGVDSRRGGEVTLFYPTLKSGTPEQALKEINDVLTLNAPLRETAYYTYRDAAIDQNGTLFLVIDRPEGQPLFTLLRERQALDLDLALSLLIQLCEMLKRAHEINIFTSSLTLHTLMVCPRPNGSMRLSLIDLALDRRPISNWVAPPPIDLISPPHPALTQERDRRHYIVYVCASLLHHLAFGVAPESPVVPQVERSWPSLPHKGRQLDHRLEACLHTVLLKGLSVDPRARFPRVSALQRTLIGLRQLTSISSPAFELLSSTQRRLGRVNQPLNLSAPRPGVARAVQARQRIHKILDGGDDTLTLEDVLQEEGVRLLR